MELIVDPPTTKYLRIAQDLGAEGWSVSRSFLAADEIRALAVEVRREWQEGSFRHARIGIGQSLQLRPEIRNDQILWLEEGELTPSQQFYFDELERLRFAINQTLFLGLFSFEGHLAVYPPGAYYRRHLDQFQGTRHRIVSCILYLSEEWQESDGGELRLYLPDGETERYIDVLPTGGTFVAFMSEMIYHEVRPARRERLSITGWFRLRS